MSRRARGVAALALGGIAIAGPSLLGRVTGQHAGWRSVVAVELAGSGQALLAAAGGTPDGLAAHRTLVRYDNGYIVVYSASLLLGSSLLRAPWRAASIAVTLATAAADYTENAALDRALRTLQTPGLEPADADRPARLARRAALLKFGSLGPAATLSLLGAVRAASRG